MPIEQLKQKIANDGLDPSIIEQDEPNWDDDSSSASASAPSAPVKKCSIDPAYKKYFKLKRMHMPIEQLKQKIANDGLDPSIIEQDEPNWDDDSSSQPAPQPSPTSDSTSAPKQPEPQPQPEPEPEPEYILYTVVKGDTLIGIARRYGTTAEELAQINDIENPSLIRPGQVLKIPVSGGDEPAPSFTVGEKVRVRPGVTTFADGTGMAAWVRQALLYVRQIEGDVILVSTEPIKNVYTGRVLAKDLVKA